LLVLFIHFTGLRRYIIGDHEDLMIEHFRHVARVVGGDDSACDLEHAAVWGRRTIGLATMGRSQRSVKLLQHTTLVSRVFGVLVDRAGIIERTSVVSTRRGG
jgi:N-acyl-D-aspartate/D-glutamate deacylase